MEREDDKSKEIEMYASYGQLKYINIIEYIPFEHQEASISKEESYRNLRGKKNTGFRCIGVDIFL